MVDLRFKTWIDDAERLLTFSEKAKEEFLNGGLHKRRSIAAALGTEHILDQGVLTIKAEKPLLLMREMASAENTSESMLNLPKDDVDKGSESNYDPEFSQRWNWLFQVRTSLILNSSSHFLSVVDDWS
jgi:hypothetical protein